MHATIPLWYIRALTLYGRMAPTEWAVLLTFAGETFSRADSIATVPYSALYSRVHGTRACIQRAVRTLATSPGTRYRWGTGVGDARMGHGLTTRTRAGQWPSPGQHRLVLDWTLWGWRPGTDFGRVAEALTVKELRASPAAQDAARLVSDFVTSLGGTPPSQTPYEPSWVVWCQAMEQLVARGYQLDQIEEALRQAEQDPFWRERLAQGSAATILEYHFTGLLLRARRAS